MDSSNGVEVDITLVGVIVVVCFILFILYVRLCVAR